MDMILLCLAREDEDAALRAAAEKVAREMDVALSVVRVSDESEPRASSPDDWTLQTDAPAAPLLNFARLNRARALILGPRAWERWGKALRAALAALTLLVAVVPGVRAQDADLRRELEELRKRLTALEETEKTPAPRLKVPQSKSEPFAFADFTWLNGNGRVVDPMIDNDWFTGQIMADANYTYSFNNPKDHSLVGACEVGRTNEIQLQHLGIGGDLHYGNIRGRLMTQFGMYSQMTPRNDSSPQRGQWGLDNAYRYLSEAYGGYHWDKMHGINLDAGIFMSYIGLASYYNNENWMYTPSYVSANTPWFFNGLRLQMFPTETFKIEPWLINGFQTYGKQNEDPGLGMQIAYRPNGNWAFVTNNYWGHDTQGQPRRQRWHSDNSALYKYHDAPNAGGVSKAAVSLTVDAGCEEGGGVSCFGNGSSGRPKQTFLGWMAYHRAWFARNKFGLTLGGGQINNPGRYLVLTPPINGATAFSGTNGHFTQNPGDSFKAWDSSVTFDYMPSQYITWRAEWNHREANVDYFAGHGGVTPAGGNQGAPGSLVAGFTPDLRKTENRITLAMLIRL